MIGSDPLGTPRSESTTPGSPSAPWAWWPEPINRTANPKHHPKEITLSEQFVDYADAAMNYVQILAAAECGDVITIMRDGEPMAVIVGVEEFDRLTAAVEAPAR